MKKIKFKVGDKVKKVIGVLSPYIGTVNEITTMANGDILLEGLTEQGQLFGSESHNYILVTDKSQKFNLGDRVTEKSQKFNLGDRVAVYDTRLVNGRQVGVVTSLTDPNGSRKSALLVDGIKRVDYKCSEIIVHPKQVRKIRGSK
jgi:hypothetical protein